MSAASCFAFRRKECVRMIQKKQEFVAIFFEAVDNVRNLCYRISEFFLREAKYEKKAFDFF